VTWISGPGDAGGLAEVVDTREWLFAIDGDQWPVCAVLLRGPGGRVTARIGPGRLDAGLSVARTGMVLPPELAAVAFPAHWDELFGVPPIGPDL